MKRWTKHVDLFSKDFIIIPINEECVFIDLSITLLFRVHHNVFCCCIIINSKIFGCRVMQHCANDAHCANDDTRDH